jgi:hypothetical protein
METKEKVRRTIYKKRLGRKALTALINLNTQNSRLPAFRAFRM